MPSPFPGMNPFLEQPDVWTDFHQSFIPAAREVLAEQVRPNYTVKIEEYLFIHELPADERLLLGRADVAVAETDAKHGRALSSTLLKAPAQGWLPVSVDIEPNSFLEIRDRQNRELVTVIELLSPSNKNPGPDREQYLAKRRRIIASSVHLVEIDLLRGGPRLPVENLSKCDYCCLISRFEERPRVGIWPIQLADRLPTIPIPLREPDQDAYLDLQTILNRVYDAAGYEDYLYSGNPQPPLSEAAAEWAKGYVPV